MALILSLYIKVGVHEYWTKLLNASNKGSGIQPHHFSRAHQYGHPF